MTHFFAAYDDLLSRWGVPVEHLEVAGEFGKTHVSACGPRDGTPVVLLAGHGATSMAWFRVAPRLASTRRVYAVDVDPTDCFTGLRATYVARALPSLLRPSERRTRAFLRWETGGYPIEPAWLDLAALAAIEPKAKVVRPRRPTAAELAGLQLQPLVVVAGRTKSHHSDKLAIAAENHGAKVVWIEAATHHTLPAAQTDELAGALDDHLPA